MQTFQEKGCVLPPHTSPNDLLSITTFNNENNTEKNVTIHNKLEHSQHIPKEIQFAAVEHDEGEKEKPKDKIEDNDNVHDDKKVTDGANDATKRTLGKRKLSFDKSITDESNIKVKKKKLTDQNMIDQKNDGNSTTESQKTCSNKTMNHKTVETDRKRKRKLTINDTLVTENINEETVKRDSHGSTTIKSDKNRIEKESINKNNHNQNNEKDSVLQTGGSSTTKDTDTVSSDIEDRTTGVDERKKKKNRKKRSKIQEDAIFNAMGMQVMAKRDWKSLRNKYLELQKSQMQQLKLHLKKARWNYDKAGQSYDKSKHEKDNGKATEVAKENYGRITYAPGIIVKIEMDEPCTDPHNFKVYLYYYYYICYNDILIHIKY